MAQLYVTKNNATIGVTNGRIEVKERSGLLRTLPIENIDGITIMGNAQITTQCIGECLRRGISVQYYSSKGAYFGKLSSTKHVNTKRQKTQARLSDNEEFSLALSKRIIKAKINNQTVILRRYQRTSVNEVNEEINAMIYLEKKVDGATSISEVIGYEGNAARLYFKGLNILVKNPDFHFKGRNRQPPRDKFNSMLSLGYSILMNEIFGAIEGRGLNPYFGFLHQDKEKHPTLASDLMEEWRAIIVDSTVMSLVNGFEISEENFFRYENFPGVFIDKDGCNIFINKLEKRLQTTMKYIDYIDYSVSFRRAFDMQALQLCKAIEEKEPTIYQPALIR